jgi:hypothetical protein
MVFHSHIYWFGIKVVLLYSLETNLDLRSQDKVIFLGMKISSLILLTLCLGFGSISNSEEESVKPIPKMTKKLNPKSAAKSFVVGGEVRSYRYEESRVTHSGLLYGVWGEWFWSSALGYGKLYGSLLYGIIDYDGYACNVDLTVCNSLKAPTTDLITRLASRFEIKLSQNFEIFAGLGYRYLYDKGEGGSFYTRTGQWGFIPLGGIFKQGKFQFELEYDLVVYGSVKSNLSEAISTLPDIESKQTGGSGLVLSGGYRFNDEFILYAFYEAWNMPDSASVIVGNTKFTEPENKAQSYGIRLGYLF